MHPNALHGEKNLDCTNRRQFANVPSPMEANVESPSVRRALALVGQVVAERYRVEGVLGEGGMGTVLKASHLLLKQPVALKVMAEDAMPDPDLRARFLREARILSELKSPHIASLYDVGVLPDGSLYLAMEYLEGKDLSEVAESAISPVRAVQFGLQICEGLAEAHQKGIVHRDLKPSNVFVSVKNGKEVLKLIDFGIAKQQHDGDSLGKTKTNLMMGSPYYMSPEQIVSSKSVDHRADIWSFGVLMFQLLSGLLPFYDESVGAILIRVHNQPTPALPPHVPAELANIVYRCLAKDRNQRYRSAKEVIAALAPLATLPNRPPPSDHLRAVEAAAHPMPQRSPAPLMVPGADLFGISPVGHPVGPAHGEQVSVPHLALGSRPSLPTSGSDLAADRVSSGSYAAYGSGHVSVGSGSHPALRHPQGAQDPTTDAAVAFAPTVPPPALPNVPSQRGLWVAVIGLGVAVSILTIALFVSRKPADSQTGAHPYLTAQPTSTPSTPTTAHPVPSEAPSTLPSAAPTTATSSAIPSALPSSRPSSLPSGKRVGVPKPPIPAKDPLAP